MCVCAPPARHPAHRTLPGWSLSACSPRHTCSSLLPHWIRLTNHLQGAQLSQEANLQTGVQRQASGSAAWKKPKLMRPSVSSRNLKRLLLTAGTNRLKSAVPQPHVKSRRISAALDSLKLKRGSQSFLQQFNFNFLVLLEMKIKVP